MVESPSKFLIHERPDMDASEAPERVQHFIATHRYFFLLLGVLVAQLLLLSLQITRGPQERLLIQVWIVSALEPFQSATHSSVKGVGGVWESFRELRDAREDNRQLRKELEEAQTSLQRLEAEVNELEVLRAQLGFKKLVPFQTIAAQVIASSPGAGNRAVFLSKGAKDGVQTDMAVISREGVVGKVLYSYRRTSQVLILTDRRSGAGCLIEGSRTQGVLKGYGRNLCRMEYVMNEQTVRVGDRVVTSGQDQIYPKGLFLGMVVEVKDGNSYKEILVKPSAKLDRLESLLVIVQSKPALNNRQTAAR